MIRVSEDQLSLLRANAEGKPVLREPRARRAKKRREDLPENIVESQVVSFLQMRGWVLTKQHGGVFFKLYKDKPSAFNIGEKSQADWRAERPIIPAGQRPGPGTTFTAELFYVEVKAPGRKPSPAQVTWLAQRQLTGITATWTSDIDDFMDWYYRRYGDRAGMPAQRTGPREKW